MGRCHEAKVRSHFCQLTFNVGSFLETVMGFWIEIHKSHKSHFGRDLQRVWMRLAGLVRTWDDDFPFSMRNKVRVEHQPVKRQNIRIFHWMCSF